MMVNARRCRFIVNEALSDEEIARIYLIKASRRRWEAGLGGGLEEDEDLLLVWLSSCAIQVLGRYLWSLSLVIRKETVKNKGGGDRKVVIVSNVRESWIYFLYY